jgi:hypothetical protein
MKPIIYLILQIIAGTFPSTPSSDMARIDHVDRVFKYRKSILMLLEKPDTLNGIACNFTGSRSYYFDKKQRQLRSVREYENNKRPQKGIRVIYTYMENHLVKVKVILPKSKSGNHVGEYYYSGDSLYTKKETGYANSNPGSFIKNSCKFQSKLPCYLPWGYFQNEVFKNGRTKKIKNWR